MKSKEIRTADMGGAADLLCPRCGYDNLHHGEVIFYERAEDAAKVVKITVNGADIGVAHGADNAGNPSARRDGMTIQFWCEHCGEDKPVLLTIAQHKGSTEIGWEFDR